MCGAKKTKGAEGPDAYKGHWEEAARVRIKVAAEAHPYRFFIVFALPKKVGGGWRVEEVG